MEPTRQFTREHVICTAELNPENTHCQNTTGYVRSPVERNIQQAEKNVYARHLICLFEDVRFVSCRDLHCIYIYTYIKNEIIRNIWCYTFY